MALKTRTTKYKQLDDMRSKWSERFVGKSIKYQNLKGLVSDVHIVGLSYKNISAIYFRLDGRWQQIWDGAGKRPAINQVRLINAND